MPDILVTKRNGVAVVSLNRPQVRNAMTLGMWRELAGIFLRMAGDDSVRAVVLATSGKDFCVGADVTEFDRVRKDKEQSAAYEVSVDDCSAAIANLPKPVIAAVSGYCLGGGCHLALACDFRFADQTAKFGIPAANLSIVYGVKSVKRLLALVGVANAKRILYSAERYDAVRSQTMGLADEICDDALSSAVAFADALAGKAPLSITGAKYMLNGLSLGDGALDVAHAQHLIDHAADSDDFREGTRAFAEKRTPRFRGS
ncbi:enoyl-CoA hydratase-related protein [Bradyrhizobium sp. dw_411]|uniref:enoyl-CoA hydratase-related protein n=1 Tax=Bradyrhizobium sp. dw_411 TaxID=2720082 RepID=UPI001BD0A930|nr:enoyl-CoA hydratase-related protein [Bradyrhizobium sp. dw_411]